MTSLTCAPNDPPAVALVVIQGNLIARYEGRQQGPVVQTSEWGERVIEFVEQFRIHGLQALEDA